MSSIRSFLEEFRDHLLLDSKALGNSATPLEGWNEERQWELALYVASQIGHAYAVESILYRETNPNAVMEDGLSSLHAACRGGHRSIVAMLLTHGADTNVTDSNGVSPLLSAVQLNWETLKSWKCWWNMVQTSICATTTVYLLSTLQWLVSHSPFFSCYWNTTLSSTPRTLSMAKHHYISLPSLVVWRCANCC
ncbi:hypothetical protein PHMEG_00012421 [Phytophthora megakarya]|uniref:Uncharacterized protein n=1 Tax=Phytophthora megakarya TaxID=4795 RepID=A0A225W8T0_9STRA|nr:hypothetical protein PHMEG_00012421 [Phytophthora megakarya]